MLIPIVGVFLVVAGLGTLVVYFRPPQGDQEPLSKDTLKHLLTQMSRSNPEE